ncbi:MAG: outer membrane beta-barrel protein [Chitinophagaceae bacterium]
MKKYIFIVVIALFSSFNVVKAQIEERDSTQKLNDLVNQAQRQREESLPKKKRINKYSNVDLSKRPHDHFIIGFAVAGVDGGNDSTSTKGFSRQVDIAFMLDKPLSNPHFSVGYGLGFMGTNLFYNDKYLNIKSQTTTLPFDDQKYSKFKLVLNYLEIPLEIRYAKNMEQPQKGLKITAGIKAGWLLKAYTKGKNALSGSSSLYGSGYVQKEVDKRFFNTTMLTGTFRVGLGAFSVFGNYSLLSMLKSGAGPTMRPYAVGFAISGL